MKKFLAITLLLFSSYFPSKACLNYFYTLNKDGEFTSADTILRAFNTNFNIEINDQKLRAIEKKLAATHDFKLLSDYSVCLMKTGKHKEALAILIELYKNFPEEYIIAANLGTAYELNGEVDSALKYIKRDLELNPMDHDGSEWVHVKVLEAKLALKKDPNYLSNHTVLQLSERQKKDYKILSQVNIQVRERFPFTPGPDVIMASLLQDLGDLFANINSIEYAQGIYRIAQNYYGDKSETLKEKIKEMQKLSKKFESKQLPPRSSMESMNEKVGFINYKQFMDDNNSQHYKINWKEINLDTKSLLALVDLSKAKKSLIDSSEIKEAEQLKTASNPNDLNPPIKGSSIFWLTVLFTTLFIPLVIIFIRRKRNK